MKVQFKQTKYAWLLVCSAIAIAVFAITMLRRQQSETSEFMTSKVDCGNIRNTVSATGTLQAVTTVQVGSQVSGTIQSLHADYNSEVQKGQVIAQLDPAIFQAQVAQARANLEQARANVTNTKARVRAAESAIKNQHAGVSSAKANLAALQAQRDDAKSFLDRQESLTANGLVTQRDLETARTSFRATDERYNQAASQLEQARLAEQSAATAGVDQARADVQDAQARVKQTEAALNLAQVNLSHTTIASPINGVVISRNVDVGQTVAASLQAPTLFTIANDLTRMQVIANIDQADIGVINTSKRVNFTVDAFPGQNFSGAIHQIRLNPQNVQNVVTYNVVIDVENPELKLKPGMTANLTVTIAEGINVLRVPNAALRFMPTGMTQEKIRALLSGKDENNAQAGEKSREKAATATGQPTTAAIIQGQRRIVWVLGADKKAQPRKIKLGITDGVHTEVTEGEVKEGDLIIIGQNITSAKQAQTSPSTQRAPGFGGTPSSGGPRIR